jgi:thiaminase/transcriptional activator TenA
LNAGLFDRLKADAAPEWRAYVGHPFVHALGDGSLRKECFRHYLVQDYLFLVQFVRAYSLGVYKAPDLETMRYLAGGAAAILDEMKLHIRLSAEWGASQSDLEQAVEARATIAYTRFVLDAGMQGDLLDLLAALSPCVIGYAEIGAALVRAPRSLAEDNPYRGWVAEYSGEPYRRVADDARAALDRLAATQLSEARYPRLLQIFRQATRLEADFWQMGLDLAE